MDQNKGVMMRLKIEIDMENAAFAENWRDEVARIIGSFSERIRFDSNIVYKVKVPLYDINGNTVGRAEVADD